MIMLTWVLVLLAAVLGIWAQTRVQSTFQKFAKVTSRRGLTGAQVARLLLDARGIQDVQVERARGMLTDHYDPVQKRLRLSEATHDSNSVAAIGVAAHETGHALQHADAYVWLGMRSMIVPVVQFGSYLLPILTTFAIFSLYASQHVPYLLGVVIIGLLGAIALFSLITLPVEIDASRRALRVLDGAAILSADEMPGAKKVLDAAALTYVAAAVSAVMQLLHWIAIIFGSRRSD